VLITGFATGASGVNCYLVSPGRGGPAIVIDPGDEAVQTLEYYFAVNDLTPAGVLLTHGHGGHTASAPDLCAGWEIPAYIHPADRALIAGADHGEPDDIVEVADGVGLHIAGIGVAVDHTPGHTDGSVVFRVGADTDEGPVGVVFTGDTLLRRSAGSAADPARLLASIADKLLVLDDETVVLPGHGSSTSIGAERRFNPLLKDLRQ
jgi:hydroxyacylglutathione hydrolase